MSKKFLGMAVLLAAVLVLAGCPDDPGNQDVYTKTMGDDPGIGLMSAQTAGSIFDYTEEAGGITINRLKNAVVLKGYLGSSTARAATGNTLFFIDTIGGKPVKKILANAFNPREGAQSLVDAGVTKVKLPATITAIADGAFANTGLEELIIPDVVQTQLGAAILSSIPVTVKKSITLRVLDYADIANETAYKEKIWNTFIEKNPYITIVPEYLFLESFHNKVAQYAADGKLDEVDVLYSWPSGSHAELLYPSSETPLLKNLTTMTDWSTFKTGYTEKSLDPAAQAGGNNFVGIIPAGTTATHVLYVNKTLLQQHGLTPATTYDDLKTQVATLNGAGKKTVLMSSDPWVSQSCLFSMIAGRFCGENWEQNPNFASTEFKDALTFVKTLYADGVIVKDGYTPDGDGSDYGNAKSRFMQGEAAYLIDGDWAGGSFKDDIDIMVFPEILGTIFNKSTSGVLSTGFGISADIADPEKIAAAWDLVKWLSGTEVQILRLEKGEMATPSRKGIDINSLNLSPVQKKLTTFDTKYEKTTAVIDGVFPATVSSATNTGLSVIRSNPSANVDDIAADIQAAL
ncbi:hypothetical protein FACS1894164_05140 [Spirochaetia bacterium]|nr:hypothetical protein FACS1894164_05140 [Spirochaetia bacterium]